MDWRLLAFDIPRLLLRRWRELAAIGLKVDQRRLVQTIETAHEHRVALYTDQLHDRGADRVRPLWRPQRKCPTRRSVVLRALQHQIAARPMQPVDHFEIAVEIYPLQGRHPRFKNLKSTNRAVVTALTRRVLARGPGRPDASDEDKPGVARRWYLGGEFAFTEFIVSKHSFQSSVIFCALITLDHRTRSASMNSAIAAELRGRNTGKPIFSSEARNASSFRARSRLAVILCAISSGSLEGAATPYHTLTR